ncbi:hypothetical protein BGW38_001813 [Lunasporangiospora selenospora]|uniref:Uncharacterized protein n=1 Tax=Lunasporangiospora selenospora TaxID=979761 RepID=A0A9P6KIV8_9FUNG|nr:hypothetical protein BGW38_001813 [Lunasporangiospora selenospora]
MEFILTWMEHRPNFESVIIGSSGRTAPGEPRKFKSHGYSALALAVSKNSKGRLNINGKAMRERFQRHLRLYTDVKKEMNTTGISITEEDTKKGLLTLAQKLETMCTCFPRMDVLFSGRLRSKATPTGRFQSTLLASQEQNGITTSARGQNEVQKAGAGPRRGLTEEYEDDKEDDEDEDEEDEDEEGEDGEEGEEEEEGEEDGHTTDNGVNGLVNNSSHQIDARDARVDGRNPSSSTAQRHAKHSLADAESEVSSKRSRTSVRRKKHPVLDRTSISEVPRRSPLGPSEQTYTTRVSESKMLKLETEKLEFEKTKESKRQEQEAKRQRLEMEKLEFEKEKAAKKQELEERKLKLDEYRLKNESQRDKLQLAMTGLAQGMSIEQIQTLINTLLTK